MIGIAKKIEEAVISVLESQTGMESVEVVRGNAAATHAVFPRVVVACKNIAPLYPGMKSPYRGILELKAQSESKSDMGSSNCENIADLISSALQPPAGVSSVGAAFADGTLNKLEFKQVDEARLLNGIFTFQIRAEIYLQA